MARVLVLYHSTYGHIEAMARAQVEGAASVLATEAVLKRVPELSADIAQASRTGPDQGAPVAAIEDLEQFDAIILGCGTRFGRMGSPMAAFLDSAGDLWLRGALQGKIGAAFTSTASQHGGQETTLFSILTNLLHFGMVLVGLPYAFAGQLRLDEISGGSPYGATTIAGGEGQRRPSVNDLDGARFQGRLVAELALQLHGAFTPDQAKRPPAGSREIWSDAKRRTA
jgi:NAD(P)H dehydrogenase (quinone)